MADQLTDVELIAKAREECASARAAQAKGSHYTWPLALVVGLADRLEVATRELGELRPEVEMLRTEAAGGVHDPHDQLEAVYAELRDERDAEKARAEKAEVRVSIAEDLLKRVVIHGGSGSWTWREMHDWCCDYKDWSNGHGRESYERPHDNCGHRKRPGTDCGAIGAGDSDEQVHHLYGPDGLWARAEAAEARVAELEGAAQADQMALDEKRQLLADLHGLTADGDLWAKLIRQRDEARERVAELEAAKDGAYAERNKLVSALSKVFPSTLERHPEGDAEWEDDWRWIVFVNLPSGQATWHIHDSELGLFGHLPRETGNVWDGHSTAQKYERLCDLSSQDANTRAEKAEARVAELEAERAWQPIETAPKDGTYIALWAGGSPAIGRWIMDAMFGAHWDIYDLTPTEDIKPTHWMPLPAPPSAGKPPPLSDEARAIMDDYKDREFLKMCAVVPPPSAEAPHAGGEGGEVKDAE